MVTTIGWLYVALIATSAVVTGALALYAYRRRDEPGAFGFAGMMASLAVWEAPYAVSLLVHNPLGRAILENVQWFGTCVYLWLLLFALEYTGYDEFATKRVFGALSAPWIASVALIWTRQWHSLWWSTTLTEVHGLAILEFSYGPGFLLHTLYSYVIILVAAVLLFRLVFVSDYLYADQSILLVFGILFPTAFNVADILVFEPGAVVDLAPVVHSVSGLAFGYALFRRRLFDLVPATRRLGRNAAIRQLETGIAILDSEYRVVYCNESAEPVLGCTQEAAIGRELRSLLDVTEIDFDAPDGLAEIERDETVYEVRTTPITDRADRTIGHTFVAHDVTARKRHERQLAAQRDQLMALSDLNRLIRGIVQALVSETDRAGIERAVCERIVEGDRYHTACIGDVATWNGEADRWTTAGTGDSTQIPTEAGEGLATAAADADEPPSRDAPLPSVAGTEGTWLVVPVAYGPTVYGAIGLATDRESVADRERAMLGELGEAVGHAINALSNRQLLSADTVVEAEFESTAAGDPLVAATDDADVTLELSGIVPAGDSGSIAYLGVTGDAEDARVALDDATSGSVRSVRSDDDGGLLEWRTAGEDLLDLVVDHGAHLESVQATDGRVEYRCEIASDDDARRLLDALGHRYDGVALIAKRERAGPVDDAASLSADALDGLTDRQEEAIEAAYRAGYFDWPRESTAEEVASAMDIAPSTLHSHLRKAEGTILGELLDRPAEGD